MLTASGQTASLRVGQAGRPRDATRDERAQETRRQILDATKRLLERRGSASIRDIETESGLARGTIYRYFESRDHIVTVLQMRWVDYVEGAFTCSSEDPTARLHGVVDATVKSIRFDPVIARAALEARQTASAGVFDACCELDRRVMAFLRDVVLGHEGAAARLAGPFRLAWYGALTQWAQGLLSIDQLDAELKEVAGFLSVGVGVPRT